jgi:hypothetical protein
MADTGTHPPILGLYSDPEPLWEAAAGLTLADWGVNAIFQHSAHITPALVERATREGARVYAEFPTFRADYLVEDHPDLWPIDATGERVPKTERFLGACPSKAYMREGRFSALRALVERYDLAGVWLDYLHFHCDFELPQPTLDQTCFCDDCLRAFAAHAGIDLPGGDRGRVARTILSHHAAAWASWKVALIAGWARRARAVLDEVRPGLLLGIYSCPWRDDEYGGALRSVLGLDFATLSMVDVWSPMVYHRKCGQTASWIAGYTAWLVTRTRDAARATGRPAPPEVWPIVDAWETDPDEFGTILRDGLAAGTGGIQVFTAGYAAAPHRREVLRQTYRGHRVTRDGL